MRRHFFPLSLGRFISALSALDKKDHKNIIVSSVITLLIGSAEPVCDSVDPCVIHYGGWKARLIYSTCLPRVGLDSFS